MESYLVMAQDRETEDIEIRVKLMKNEKDNLLVIRHLIVEWLTNILEPDATKVTFKFLR